MPVKPLKRLKKNPKFEQWQIDFLKNGPPDNWDKTRERWHYLSLIYDKAGRELWGQYQNETDDVSDCFFALEAHGKSSGE